MRSKHDFWHLTLTLTYNANLAKVKDDRHTKSQGRRLNNSAVRGRTDATKYIISLASRSIKRESNMKWNMYSLYCQRNCFRTKLETICTLNFDPMHGVHSEARVISWWDLCDSDVIYWELMGWHLISWWSMLNISQQNHPIIAILNL